MSNQHSTKTQPTASWYISHVSVDTQPTQGQYMTNVFTERWLIFQSIVSTNTTYMYSKYDPKINQPHIFE